MDILSPSITAPRPNTIGGLSLRPFDLAGPSVFALPATITAKLLPRVFPRSPLVPSVNHFVATIAGKPLFLHLQNVHRYFFYLAVLFIIFLWYDAIRSFSSMAISALHSTLVLTINVTLLSLYTFSCHSLRHWRAQTRLFFLRDLRALALCSLEFF